ncbi:MAG: allantoinase PuuE [Rhodospirillales bacterium]|nr:allantoinase PuuE [Rhodospirillales bacterium]
MSEAYPRDPVGYGAASPDAAWPGGARLALQIVLNYEEGAEANILDGDPGAEALLSDLGLIEPLDGRRNLLIESLYEYGARAGFWRLYRLFVDREVPITVFAVGQALVRNPEAAAAIAQTTWEVAGHGWRWIDYGELPEAEERRHMARTVQTIRDLTGRPPAGWYAGRPSLNTRRLAVEAGGFLYDSDAYNDDLPYWTSVSGKPHLVVPYSLDNNDSRFTRSQGFDLADDFFTYLKDGFDRLYEEGATSPKMMSVGLHPRLVGRPGRVGGLVRFLDYVQGFDRVWLCRRVDIAQHWIRHHPAP